MDLPEGHAGSYSISKEFAQQGQGDPLAGEVALDSGKFNLGDDGQILEGTILLMADTDRLLLISVSGPGELAASFAGKEFWREIRRK